jgi:LAO/AO transport system kinase
MQHLVSDSVQNQLEGVRTGDFRQLARTITQVENNLPGTDAILLGLQSGARRNVVGITGPPGAGKSTLVNALVGHWIAAGKKIAVLAVDPSSPFNLGALLGDRIRLAGFYTHPNVFIRSLASRGSLGGLHPAIVQVTDLVREAPFDLILIETVGVGQSEIEIAGLADCTVVTLVPESGDEVQAMKSGLLEIADVFVINKGDRPEADAMVRRIRTMAHERMREGVETPVLKTTATSGEGVSAVAKRIEKALSGTEGITARQQWLRVDKVIRMAMDLLLKDTSRDAIAAQLEQTGGKGNLYQTAQWLRNQWRQSED